MKQVPMYEKGEEVYIKMQITKVTLEGSTHKYELMDPKSGKFMDEQYTFERLIPIPEETEA